MARRQKKKGSVVEAEIPMSSMIDVVFLLLIYFVVTQKPIIEDTLLGMNLPSDDKSATSTPPKDDNKLMIDVFNLGREDRVDSYHVNGGGPHKLKSLRENYFQDLDPETTIIINCGPNARHAKLIQLLDALAEANLTKLNLINDPNVKFAP